MTILHFDNSYKIWSPIKMCNMMQSKCDYRNVTDVMNRSLLSLWCEWWLHNIGYYLTKPFLFLKGYNLRFKDVDLEEYVKRGD